jgi:phenylacetate-CoA ligase
MPLGFKARTITQLKDLLLNRKRMVSFEINRSNSIDFYNILKKFKARFLYGLVNTTVEFTKELIDAGLDPAALRLNAVITTGEILFPFQRDFLKQAFRCPIVNEYGTTENGIVAFECKKGKLHLLTHNVYVEFENPETNQPAKPGELGEVIITELHSYAMPFIRYKVGDLARPSDETCDCGLELPVISEVVGRVSDLIITPDGRQVSSAILSYSMPKGVKRFRTFQKSPLGIEVLIQEKASISKDDILSLEKKLRHYLGDEIKIDIKKVDTIPIDSSGKFRHFVTEINHESYKVR